MKTKSSLIKRLATLFFAFSIMFTTIFSGNILQVNADTVANVTGTSGGWSGGSNKYQFSYLYNSSTCQIVLYVTCKNSIYAFGGKTHLFSVGDTTDIPCNNPTVVRSMESAIQSAIDDGINISIEKAKKEMRKFGSKPNSNGVWKGPGKYFVGADFSIYKKPAAPPETWTTRHDYWTTVSKESRNVPYKITQNICHKTSTNSDGVYIGSQDDIQTNVIYDNTGKNNGTYFESPNVRTNSVVTDDYATNVNDDYSIDYYNITKKVTYYHMNTYEVSSLGNSRTTTSDSVYNTVTEYINNGSHNVDSNINWEKTLTFPTYTLAKPLDLTTETAYSSESDTLVDNSLGKVSRTTTGNSINGTVTKESANAFEGIHVLNLNTPSRFTLTLNDVLGITYDNYGSFNNGEKDDGYSSLTNVTEYYGADSNYNGGTALCSIQLEGDEEKLREGSVSKKKPETTVQNFDLRSIKRGNYTLGTNGAKCIYDVVNIATQNYCGYKYKINFDNLTMTYSDQNENYTPLITNTSFVQPILYGNYNVRELSGD